MGFVTYTKGAEMWVVVAHEESRFLDWFNQAGRTSQGYARETSENVCIRCAPIAVHQTEKREATILKLVDKDVEDKSA